VVFEVYPLGFRGPSRKETLTSLEVTSDAEQFLRHFDRGRRCLGTDKTDRTASGQDREKHSRVCCLLDRGHGLPSYRTKIEQSAEEVKGAQGPGMERRYLDGLNPEQRQAAEHGGDAVDGPLLIIAGAGSGKTNTLAHRVAHLIVTGTDANRILLLTFSRRAAQAMRRRVEQIVAPNARHGSKIPWAGTFHAIGARLLRVYARQIELDPGFTILDRGDAEDALNYVRDALGFSASEMRFPTKGTCLAIYSRVVNSALPLEDVLDHAFPFFRSWEAELRALFTGYVAAKQSQRLLDYDDLLLYWSQMMLVPELAADVSARFDHILVDEYQDTNKLQSSILMNMRPDGRCLAVVGDDAQAIYAFRAATVRNILDFPGQFQPPARIIALERNYRSTQPILDASNAVIGMARERYRKQLWSERSSQEKPMLVTVADGVEQARYVADKVLENREQGATLKAQAVLFRAGHHSALLELELSRRNIPFIKFGGLRFLDAAHVKDVLAVLRWASNPRDNVAAFRVLLLFSGVGPKSARRILTGISDAHSLLAKLEGFRPPAGAAAAWPDFVELMRHLATDLAGWPSEFDAVRRWYQPLLELRHEGAKGRASDLEQLGQIAGSFASREQFLTDLAIDPPQAGSDEAGAPSLDEDYLTLSTIHSAKGLEWASVFVLNVVDGCIPSDLGVGTPEEIEEERRLLYVAMTRAKDHLHLLIPRQFHVTGRARGGDRYVTAARTRFIPRCLLSNFDQVTWPGAGTVDLPSSSKSRNNVAAGIRDLWR
jgi:DNA helicase-2/ATP-dependent DNA helicase PcrA